MKELIKRTKTKLKIDWLLVVLLLLGTILRFYKLDWGEGYFFHPDEYHVAHAVSQLSFPSQMNPHLFSYGSFTVYLIYFSQLFLGFWGQKFLILNPILLGRFHSAFFSSLTIFVVFLISQVLFKKKFLSYLAAFLVAFTPGLIQQAHFTTPESILTLWLFLTLFLWIKWTEKKKSKFLYLSAVSLGLALGTKIVALTFLPILIILTLANLQFKSLKNLIRSIKPLVLCPLFIGLIFFLVFPYSLLDWQSFRHSINWEAGVGRGEPIVFYTRQFIDTTPISFQYQRILPYVLGPATLILGTLGLLLMAIIIIKKIFKKKPDYNLIILLLAFLAYLLPNAFLFAKWTRFVAPAFPFFALFATYFVSVFIKKRTSAVYRFLFYGLSILLITANLVWSLMFFSIYFQSDVRITTTRWLNQNFSSQDFILTESGNMLEVPLEGNLQKKAFDFYGLDEQPELQNELPKLLVQADYFIIQSRRIFLNHQRLPNQFPITANFFNLLFSGQLGFEKIKEFSSYPQFSIGHLKIEIPDEVGEETWSVFDHPVIRIYKKVKPLSFQDYEKILKI